MRVMKLLTQIPINEIPRGILYCRSKTDRLENMTQLNSFWTYFTDTWLRTYQPRDWNVSILATEDINVTVVNRTNNPLERFNRKMNDAFPTAHPSMHQFIDTIREISNEYVDTNKRIAQGSMSRPVHAPPTMYSIPADYATFIQ